MCLGHIYLKNELIHIDYKKLVLTFAFLQWVAKKLIPAYLLTSLKEAVSGKIM